MKKHGNFLIVYLIGCICLLVLVMAGKNILSKTNVPSDIFFHTPIPDTLTVNSKYKVPVNVEDSIKFLGYDSGKIWAENKDGVRGYLGNSNLMLKIISGQTIYDLEDYHIEKGAGCYFTTVKRIEQYAVGRSFEEVEKKWRIATLVSISDSVIGAYYKHIAAITSYGKIYHVKMLYDENRICKSVLLIDEIRSSNDLLIENLPFVNQIASQDWLMWFVQDGIYNKSHDTAWYWKFLRYLVTLFLQLCWVLLPMMIPLMLFTLVLTIVRPLRLLPNWLIIPIGAAFVFAGIYCWVIALLCSGYYWLLILPLAIYALYGQMVNGLKEIFYGDNSNASLRCPKCKAMDSFVEIKREVLKEQIVNEPHNDHHVDEVEEYDRDEKTKFYRTIRNSYGSETETLYEALPVYKVQEIHKYHKYTIKYHVSDLKITYQCTDCGYIDVKYTQEKTETGRTDDGTETKIVELPEKIILPKPESEDGIHITYSFD